MNSSTPKVSVIMTIYKRQFLKQSIDSVLAQTCRDFELVMVDDKSPENLYEVIEEYPWEKNCEVLPDGGRKWMVDGIQIRYYQNEEDIGEKDLVAAWNHAMGYATGEWCVLASDDDVYMPTYLGEMLRLAVKYPKCDLFHCRLAVINAEGNWIRVGRQWSEFIGQIPFVYAKAVLRQETYAPDFMFRRSAYTAIGGFVSFPLAIYSDDATWMLLARNGVGCSGSILFCWRASGVNICTRTDNALGKLRACEAFRMWFNSFTASLNPESQEDVLSFSSLNAKTNAQVDSLARYVVRQVKPFFTWMSVLRKSPQTFQFKKDCFYDRFPRIRALRFALLPPLQRSC